LYVPEGARYRPSRIHRALRVASLPILWLEKREEEREKERRRKMRMCV
jgi:hypothetical protein